MGLKLRTPGGNIFSTRNNTIAATTNFFSVRNRNVGNTTNLKLPVQTAKHYTTMSEVGSSRRATTTYQKPTTADYRIIVEREKLSIKQDHVSAFLSNQRPNTDKSKSKFDFAKSPVGTYHRDFLQS